MSRVGDGLVDKGAQEVLADMVVRELVGSSQCTWEDSGDDGGDGSKVHGDRRGDLRASIGVRKAGPVAEAARDTLIFYTASSV